MALYAPSKISIFRIIVLIAMSFKTTSGYTFSREYFGVSFSPYGKDFEGDTTPPWSTYTSEDLKVMIKVVSTRFAKLATYGSGASDANFNTTWDKGDGNAFVARAAALVNKEAGEKRVTVALGMWQNANQPLRDKEIEYGFAEAEDANSIFPGTVWALIFYTAHLKEAEVGGPETLQTIQMYKDRAHRSNLLVGTRIDTCEQINGGLVKEFIERVVLESDYIMCNLLLRKGVSEDIESPESAVQQIGKRYWNLTQPIKALNPKIQVLVGDTGWPSSGVSFSGTSNTLRNMRDFWQHLNNWAVENKVNVQVFEAYDEPWKISITDLDEKNAGGKFGAERHFGWFKLLDNTKITEQTILEKVTEIEEPVPVWIMVLIALWSVLVICAVVFAIFYREYRNQRKTLHQLAEAEILEFERGNPEAMKDSQSQNVENEDLAWNFPYNREYEIPKDELVIDESKILGSGEFGMVYKGTINQKEAAVKTTKPRSSPMTLKSLLSEIKTMIYLGKHLNVVEFMGAYTGELRQGIVYIIMEFCPGGSLESHLRNIRTSLKQDGGMYQNIEATRNANQELSNLCSKLLKWTFEIARGMEFLANKHVIHADLATRNVLLTSNETAKITDFGLSRRLYEYTEYVKKNQEPLPWRWMSPESLHSMTFSSQSDVWSYGVTLWEIFSLGDIPYPGLSWTISFVDELFAGMKPTCPKYATPNIYEMMVLCWEIKPENRPTFTVLKQRFNMQ